MTGWFSKRWQARQRAMDVKWLWPALKTSAPSLSEAKKAFTYHAQTEKAWQSVSEDEINRQIEGLK